MIPSRACMVRASYLGALVIAIVAAGADGFGPCGRKARARVSYHRSLASALVAAAPVALHSSIHGAERGYVLAVSKDGSVEMMASDPIQNICALGPGLKRSNHDPPRYHASTLGRRGLFDAACIDAIHTDAMLPDAVLMTARVRSRSGES